MGEGNFIGGGDCSHFYGLEVSKKLVNNSRIFILKFWKSTYLREGDLNKYPILRAWLMPMLEKVRYRSGGSPESEIPCEF